MKKKGNQWDAVKDCGHSADERRHIRAAWGESNTVEHFVASLGPVCLSRIAVDVSEDEHADLLVRKFVGVALDCSGLLRPSIHSEVVWVQCRLGDRERLAVRIPDETSIGMSLRDGCRAAAHGFVPLAISAATEAILREVGARYMDRVAVATREYLGPFVVAQIKAKGEA